MKQPKTNDITWITISIFLALLSPKPLRIPESIRFKKLNRTKIVNAKEIINDK